jgi:hypothetical protein
MYGRGEKSVHDFVGKPLRRLRCRQKDGIRMDLRKVDWGGVEWI